MTHPAHVRVPARSFVRNFSHTLMVIITNMYILLLDSSIIERSSCATVVVPFSVSYLTNRDLTRILSS